MTWNHRWIRHTETVVLNGVSQTETWLSLHEVYYDDQGNIQGCTVNPIELTADDSQEGIEWIMNCIAQAYLKPILNYDDIVGSDDETN